MNSRLFAAGFLSVGGLMIAAANPAAARSPDGPYVAVGGGYDSMPDRDLDISGHPVTSQWRSGKGAFAALGYRFSPNLRAEVEFSGRDAEVKTFNGVNPWSGKQWDASIMVNGFYDVNLHGPLTPFVGGGL